MKKTSFVILLSLALVLAVALAAVQFWLKPTLEEEFSKQATEYFTRKGFTPKEPIRAHISPISRVLEIEPFELQKNAKLGFEKGEFKKSVLHLTWHAVLSLSPFADKLPQSGRVTILDSGTLSELDLKLSVGTVEAKNLTLGETDIDAQDLLNLVANKDVPNPDITTRDLRLESMRISDGGESRIEFSSLVVTGISKQEVRECSFENMLLTESGKEIIRVGKFRQEHIAVYTENEWKALLPGLTSPKESVRTDTVLNMIMGEKPLVEKTTLSDITFKYEKNPLIIGEAQFEVAKNAEKIAFSVSRIAIPCKIIEEEVGKPLYVPDVVHMNTSFSANRLPQKGYTLAADLGVDKLFALETKILSEQSSLSGLAENFMTTPFRDFSIRYTDQTLLARVLLYFVPQGSGKNFLLDQLKEIDTQSNEDAALLKKIEEFITAPGAIEIATKKNNKFTLAKLAAMEEEDLPQLFDVTVLAGSEDLDEQMKRIVQERQKQ